MDRFHHTVKAGSLKRFALQAEAIAVSLSDRASFDSGRKGAAPAPTLGARCADISRLGRNAPRPPRAPRRGEHCELGGAIEARGRQNGGRSPRPCADSVFPSAVMRTELRQAGRSRPWKQRTLVNVGIGAVYTSTPSGDRLLGKGWVVAPGEHDNRVRYFHVPYGSLVPLDNLLIAGRSVAGDKISHAPSAT